MNVITNQFILGLSATATDDSVNKAKETKYTTYRKMLLSISNNQISLATTHFSTLHLADGGPRQGHCTLEQNEKRNAQAKLFIRRPYAVLHFLHSSCLKSQLNLGEQIGSQILTILNISCDSCNHGC